MLPIVKINMVVKKMGCTRVKRNTLFLNGPTEIANVNNHYTKNWIQVKIGSRLEIMQIIPLLNEFIKKMLI